MDAIDRKKMFLLFAGMVRDAVQHSVRLFRVMCLLGQEDEEIPKIIVSVISPSVNGEHQLLFLRVNDGIHIKDDIPLLVIQGDGCVVDKASERELNRHGWYKKED